MLLCLPAAAAPWQPTTVGAAGFVAVPVVTGLQQPTSFAFAPDGRIFVAEKEGAVRVFKNGALLPTPFYSLLPNLAGEHGLVGIALHPAFASNGFVYLYYVTDVDPANPTASKTSRLLRVTAVGDVAQAGSEAIILGSVGGTPSAPSCDNQPVGADCLPADSGQHVSGSLRFAPDGTLLVTAGDAAFHATSRSLRAQNLDSLGGKILRINPDGTGRADNPFYNGNVNSNRSKIWAYGLRNPFRFSLQPITNVPYIGDVGSYKYEEINAAPPGANLGWPCYEGPDPQPDYASQPVCQALYATPGAVTPPAKAFPRPGEGGAITGGVFYQGTNYPAFYQGAYFLADSVSGDILTYWPATGVASEVLSGGDAPVEFQSYGPAGDIYYLSFIAGEVRRIDYLPGNRPPDAVATSNKVAGLTPLTVNFTGNGSSDPDGDPISYSWNFGDGGTSTAASPSHTFVTNGTFTVTLTVRDPSLATDTATIIIHAGKQPPQAFIDGPATGALYTAGEAVVYYGHATDAEDGTLPSTSMTWNIVQRHCVATVYCHMHPFLTVGGVGGSFVGPDHGVEGSDYFFLEINLTVVDTDGLSASATTAIGPDINDDGCMDAFWKRYTQTLPYAAATAIFAAYPAQHPGMSFQYAANAATGAFNGTTIVAATEADALYGASITLLLNQFNADSAQTWALSFDVTGGGYRFATSGGGTAITGTQLVAAIFRASDFHAMTPFLPLNPAIDVVSPGGPDFEAGVPTARKQYAMSATLPAGSYYWALALLAEDGAIKDSPGAATIAASHWAGTLHGVTVCQTPWIVIEGKPQPLIRRNVNSVATATIAGQHPAEWAALGADTERRLQLEAQKLLRSLQDEGR